MEVENVVGFSVCSATARKNSGTSTPFPTAGRSSPASTPASPLRPPKNSKLLFSWPPSSLPGPASFNQHGPSIVLCSLFCLLSTTDGRVSGFISLYGRMFNSTRAKSFFFLKD